MHDRHLSYVSQVGAQRVLPYAKISEEKSNYHLAVLSSHFSRVDWAPTSDQTGAYNCALPLLPCVKFIPLYPTSWS